MLRGGVWLFRVCCDGFISGESIVGEYSPTKFVEILYITFAIKTLGGVRCRSRDTLGLDTAP